MDAVGYGRHMKLTTQLVSFITLCVIAAMAVVMLGGVFSFRQMGMELQQNRGLLVEIIDKQLGVTDDQQAFARWLPSPAAGFPRGRAGDPPGQAAGLLVSRRTTTDRRESADPLQQSHSQSGRHAGRVQSWTGPFKEFAEYSMQAMFGISSGLLSWCLASGIPSAGCASSCVVPSCWRSGPN